MFGFNKTLLPLTGTKFLFHKKTLQQKTWDTHAVDGWYILPAMENHSCYRVYVTKIWA